MNLIRQSLKKLEHTQTDRQTDTQTDATAFAGVKNVECTSVLYGSIYARKASL